MKKLLFPVLILASLSVFAESMPEDKSDGCGLGWQVTQDKTLFATSTRGTTNYIIPPTFGMTSGTMDCERHDVVKNGVEAKHFAEANFENLSIELAQGNGEYANTFAGLMGCDAAYITRAQAVTFVAPQDMINGGCL